MRFFLYLMCAALVIFYYIKVAFLLYLYNLFFSKLFFFLKKEHRRLSIVAYLKKIWLFYFNHFCLRLNFFLLSLAKFKLFKGYIIILLKFKHILIYYFNKIWSYVIKFDLVNTDEKITIFRYVKLWAYIIYITVYYIGYVSYHTMYGLYLSVYYILFAVYLAYRLFLSLPRIIFETIKGLLFMSYKIIWYIVSSLAYMFFHLFIDCLYIIFHLPSIIREIIRLIFVVKLFVGNKFRNFKSYIRLKIFNYLLIKYTIIKLNTIWGFGRLKTWIQNPNITDIRRFYYWACFQYKLLKQPSERFKLKTYFNLIVKLLSLIFYNISYIIYWVFWISCNVFIWFIFVFLLCVIAHSFFDYINLNQYETSTKVKILRVVYGCIMYTLLIIILTILSQLLLGFFLAINSAK